MQLCRELAAAQLNAVQPKLALSLNNLAGKLSDLGRRQEALERAQEAVELYRELAAAQPVSGELLFRTATRHVTLFYMPCLD